MAIYLLDVRLRAVNPAFSILLDALLLRLCIFVRIYLTRASVLGGRTMKLLAIIVDADGVLHIEATRPPDLRRLEISNLTGKAELVFCAAPPAGFSAEQIAKELIAILNGNERAHAMDRARIVRRAMFHIYILPAVKAWGGHWRRRCRFVFWVRTSEFDPVK